MILPLNWRYGMAPIFTTRELSAGEWREVQRLLQTPALWAFAYLAGAFGLPRAVEACGAGGPEIDAMLARGDYTRAHLPEKDSIRSALWACRLIHRRGREDEPLQTTAQALGGTLEQAHTALRAHAAFNPPAHHAVKQKAAIT